MASIAHPHHNSSWAQAKRAWASGALTPWERIGAVVATGQLMRVGLEATGAERALYDWATTSSMMMKAETKDESANTPPTTTTKANAATKARAFFRVQSEDDVHLVPYTEAINEFKQRLAHK
jgi:hypothetical protein